MSASIANSNNPRRLKAAPVSRTVCRLGHAEPSADQMRLIERLAPPRCAVPESAVPPQHEHVGRFNLRSTVTYRVEGRSLCGQIIGISLGGPVRYDIRRMSGPNGKREKAARISYGVPHEDIEKLVVPPPGNQKIIVLSDLPPEPPALVGQGTQRPEHKGFFAQLWRRRTCDQSG